MQECVSRDKIRKRTIIPAPILCNTYLPEFIPSVPQFIEKDANNDADEVGRSSVVSCHIHGLEIVAGSDIPNVSVKIGNSFLM